MNRSKRLEAGSPWILLVGTLLIWQLLCSAFKVSEFIFPSPLRICEQLMAFRGEVAKHAWRTDWVTMPGVGIAIVVGVLPGFLIGSSRLVYSAICPLMIGFNALPKAAFVPILVGWFGIGVGPAVLTAFLISFFPITVNIATGLATLVPELEDLLRVLGVKHWHVLVSAGSNMQMGLAFAGLVVVGAMAMLMYQFFAVLERRITGWAHRGSQNH